MNTNVGSGFFDIASHEGFFRSLCRVANELSSAKARSTEQLLYLVMGTNHLRDWIAPGFGRRWTVPATPEQAFY